MIKPSVNPNKFQRLCELIAQLRDPETGCPWDLKQTHSSLKPYLIEEAYELIDAIDQQPDQIKYELGDVLLQVMLHAQIASDEQRFNIGDVIDALNNKLIERHPHVFGDKQVNSAEAVAENWTKAKQKKAIGSSILGEISNSLPALHKAGLLGTRAATIGFDWPDHTAVLGKIAEEIEELKQAALSDDNQAIEEELGDLLFAAAQLARKLNANPEEALQQACRKFTKRFKKMEALADRQLAQLNSTELEQLWLQVKEED